MVQEPIDKFAQQEFLILRTCIMLLMFFNLFFRTLSLTLHVVRAIYWMINEKSSHAQKPKLRQQTGADLIKRSATMTLGIVIGAQLLGLNLFPFTNNILIQLIGLFLVLIGIGMSIAARKELGSNWTHAAEYQIKSQQTLVITGVYKYIRNPIYAGMSLAYVGAEFVSGSWLFLPLIIVLAFVNVRQAFKEEKILIEKYGLEYRIYQQTSRRFIPFLY